MMKMKNDKPIKMKEIRTFLDIQEEKKRLKHETAQVEERMNMNYSNIKEALTPANILKSILEEIATSTAWVSGAYSIGQKIFSKKKKKKKVIEVDSKNEL